MLCSGGRQAVAVKKRVDRIMSIGGIAVQIDSGILNRLDMSGEVADKT